MARSRVGKKLTVNFTDFEAISGLQFGQEALRKGAMLIRELAEFRGHLYRVSRQLVLTFDFNS